MATAWITSTISSAVSGAISGTVATAGDFAGGAVASVGNSINGVGESIDNTIRGYGNAAKDYGNAIKDWTQAPGARVGSAANPLGLSDSPTGGRRGVTAPSISAATNTPSKKPTAGMKALPAPKGMSAAPKALPAPKGVPAQKALSAPNKSVGGGAKAVVPKTPVGTATARTAVPKKPVAAPQKKSAGASGGGYGRGSASNPLGI